MTILPSGGTTHNSVYSRLSHSASGSVLCVVSWQWLIMNVVFGVWLWQWWLTVTLNDPQSQSYSCRSDSLCDYFVSDSDSESESLRVRTQWVTDGLAKRNTNWYLDNLLTYLLNPWTATTPIKTRATKNLIFLTQLQQPSLWRKWRRLKRQMKNVSRMKADSC